uniref:Protein dead ringer homolog isoform X2 n=1 Tax=Saccoglossus kowalevskii TaxID=10224 RepID=A0ABM0M7A4_SACKO|nr:PREDICTED: protein dead ringer homolog isoform X2 [Saccoglossus kowalevskii]
MMTTKPDTVRAYDLISGLKFYGSVDSFSHSAELSRPGRIEALKVQFGEEQVMDSLCERSRESSRVDMEREEGHQTISHPDVTTGDKHENAERNVVVERNGDHSPVDLRPQITVKTESRMSPMGIQRKYQHRINADDHELEGEDRELSPDIRYQQHPPHTPTEKTSPPPNSQEWTFEEQFKQLYELSDDPKRKEFLDNLFSYMQKRGTPVNRIPIMAKQTLDLYELFKLVVSKGGLVEVINKKLWREITKGLSLPSSITSAAFTLRTQYMKYLYPYECEKLKMSSPAELQAAIDGNRREGRRPSYSSPGSFLHSPGSPPPSMVPQALRIPNNSGNNGSASLSSDEDSLPSTPTHRSMVMNHHGIPLEATDGGPPPKRHMMSDDQIRQIQQLQSREMPQSTHIKITNSGMPMLELRGDNSLIVSIELNGVLYQGILYARGTPGHPLHGAPTSAAVTRSTAL